MGVHGVPFFYNISDPVTEALLYGVVRVGHSTDIRLEKVPGDDSSQLRHLLEDHGLGNGLFETIAEHLAGQSL